MAAENFKVKKGLEVGTGITANSDGIIVSGIVTATQFRGDGSGLTGVVASGTGIVIKEEGTSVGTAGTINFVGSNILATLSEGTATVTVNNSTLSSLNVTGVSTFLGDIDLGNAAADTITALGRFDSDLIPSTGNTRDLGTNSFQWKDLYLDGTANIDVLDVSESATFSDNVFINSDGKVGINSSTPNKQLDVIGDAGMLVASTTNGGISSTTGISIFLSDNRLDPPNANHDLDQIGEINYKHFDVETPEGNYSDVFTFKSTPPNLAVDIHGTLLVGVTTSNQGGKVGIGTSIPAAKLDVVGNTELDDLNVSGITTLGSGGSVIIAFIPLTANAS